MCKYMDRLVLAWDRFLLPGREDKVGHPHGENDAELDTMDYPELIAWATSHIPDKGRPWLLRVIRQRPSGQSPQGRANGVPERVVEEDLPPVPCTGGPR